MLKVGIIGTGAIAREHALAIRLLTGKVMLHGAADVVPERLVEFTDSYPGIQPFFHAKALIENPEIDLVTIATPPSTHESLIISSLAAGKYVLCEKPISHSMASAERIVAAAKEYPGRLSICHQLRFDQVNRRLLRLCKDNGLGEVKSALVERHGSKPEQHSWWGDWQVAGGGVLITQLIHQIDLLIEAIGMPTSITAKMDTRFTSIESEDWIEAVLYYENNVRAKCVASVNSGRFDEYFMIQGAKGSIALPWDFRSYGQDEAERIIVDQSKVLPNSLSTPTVQAAHVIRNLKTPPVKPERLAFAHFYNQIADNIASGTPLPIGPESAIQPLMVCLAAYEAAITGKKVQFPMTKANKTYHGITSEMVSNRFQHKNLSTSSNRTINRIPLAILRELRIGLIGLDTSHAPTFCGILNDPFHRHHIPGARVVAAYAGGSPDMEISSSRVSGFTSEVNEKYGVAILETPELVAETSDILFILACDGRKHVPLVQTVARFGKPIFLDKPFALSSLDAATIFKIGTEAGVRIFGASAFRYANDLVAKLVSIRASGERIKACNIRFWLHMQPTQGRYYWYGIHAAEMLIATMGIGVETVEVIQQGDDDHIQVKHRDGRKSCMVGSTTVGEFQISIETDRRIYHVDLAGSMGNLSAKLLWAALDKLTDGCYPRLWSGTPVGSVSGTRPSRSVDPGPFETTEVIRLLDTAERSFVSHRAESVANCELSR